MHVITYGEHCHAASEKDLQHLDRFEHVQMFLSNEELGRRWLTWQITVRYYKAPKRFPTHFQHISHDFLTLFQWFSNTIPLKFHKLSE